MYKTKPIAFALLLTILSVALAGCAHTTEYEKVSMSASWAYNYKDVKELAQSSDLIALISIEGSRLDDTSDITQTIYQAAVKEQLYGEPVKEVDIVMTGGIVGNTIYEIEDDPLMKERDEFLIFARKNADDTYTILSGPQGRFVIQDHSVYSLNACNEQVKQKNNGSNIRVQGESAETFLKKVKSYVVA